MKFFRSSTLRASTILGLALLSASSLSHATLTGVSSDPMGAAWQRGDANSGYAVWDTFPSLTFSGAAPGSASGVTTPTLSQTSTFTNFAQGAGIYNVSTSSPAASNGDVLFGGSNNVNFVISGSVDFTIHGLFLQMKRPGSQNGLADGSPNYFIPLLSINGGAGIAADLVTLSSGATGNTSSDSPSWSTSTWSWGNSLNGLTGNSTYTITIAKTAFQRNLDTISVDMSSTAPIPEPSTWALAFAAGVGLLFVARRRSRSAIQD